MKIAITGGTGFVGQAAIARLSAAGHELRGWRRESSATDQVAAPVEWVAGELGDPAAARNLVAGCDAVVHSGLARSGASFQATESDVAQYARINIVGSIELIEAAIAAGVSRFIFLSTCAVHDHILDDRPLDEAHPLWANTHYGAYKAAVEKFVHSFGLGRSFPICALRPTGIYGLKLPAEHSKWFELIKSVAEGQTVSPNRGGKEVHVADVARAVELLLTTKQDICGQAYSCYDRYISEFDVATIAKELSGSSAVIEGQARSPQHEIVTEKIRSLGMSFGGERRLRETIEELLKYV